MNCFSNWSSLLISLNVLFSGCFIADVVFVFDSSKSISAANWPKVLGFAKDVVNFMTIGPKNIQIGVASFGTGAQTEFFLNRYSRKRSVCKSFHL